MGDLGGTSGGATGGAGASAGVGASAPASSSGAPAGTGALAGASTSAPASAASGAAHTSSAGPQAPSFDTGAGADPAAVGADAAGTGASSADAAGYDFPSPDSFGWDAWDGAGYDSFPDQIRPWAERLGEHYSSKHSDLQAQLADAQSQADLTKWLTENSDTDTQVSELTTRYSSLQEEHNAIKAAHEAAKAEHAEYKAAIEAREQAYAADVSQRFITDNQEILSKPGVAKGVADLLEADPDFNPMVGLKVAEIALQSGQSEHVFAEATKLAQAKIPQGYFFEMLNARIGGGGQAPRSGGQAAGAVARLVASPTAGLQGSGVGTGGQSSTRTGPPGLRGLSDRLARHVRTVNQ